MKHARLIFFFILTVLHGQVFAREPQNYGKYANEVMKKYARDVKKKYGLVCIGTGGRMPYSVEVLDVSFIAYKRASIEEARELQVKCTELLIEAINSHEKIRPFLKNFPANINNARIDISFYDKHNKPYFDGSVSFVFVAKNKVYFEIEDAATGKLSPALIEPYEEALRIVRAEKSSR